MAQRPINVLLLGFGNVGQAFARMALDKAAHLRSAGLEIRVLGVSTGSHGCTFDPTGAVDLAACLRLVEEAGEAGSWRLPAGPRPVNSTDSLLQAAADAVQAGSLRVDAVLEAIPADYATGEPALSYLARAIAELKCHVVTASKGPVLHGFRSLTAAAEAQGKRFLFESSVMDGVPVFSFVRAMPGARVKGFDGILNSTTNIILTEMEEKQCSFADALATAQRDGIAERDPSGDIDGHDAAIKVAVLATVLLGAENPQVATAGIGAVTLDDINAATSRGTRLKLVCSCTRSGGDGGDGASSVAAKVELVELPRTSMLSGIAGASSVVRVLFEDLSPISIVSHDPLNADTAFGLFSDLLTAVSLPRDPFAAM
jgi:homoserine dehydrogenase